MNEISDGGYAVLTKELGKSFGKTTAFSGVNIAVGFGQIFGLLGPDGAGKTSLIRVLLDIYGTSSGEKLVLGRPETDSVRDHIGYVPQKFSLYSDLTVWENIELFGSLFGANRKQTKELGESVLKFTRLIEFKNRLAGNLSGGMKQKLALAAGLLHKPKILFMDEPTTGVDPVSRRQFWQMLYRLREDGLTIFVSTPYMDEAELCTNVGFMHKGKIIAQATPLELKQGFPYKIIETETNTRTAAGLASAAGVCKFINIVGNKLRVAVSDEPAAIEQLEILFNNANLPFTGFCCKKAAMEDVFVWLASE